MCSTRFTSNSSVRFDTGELGYRGVETRRPNEGAHCLPSGAPPILFVDLGTVENKNSKVAEPSLTVRPNVPIMPADRREPQPKSLVAGTRRVPSAGHCGRGAGHAVVPSASHSRERAIADTHGDNNMHPASGIQKTVTAFFASFFAPSRLGVSAPRSHLCVKSSR
jgi:hypothetical protein